MKFCRFCGKLIPKDSLYCEYCGHNIAPTKPEPAPSKPNSIDKKQTPVTVHSEQDSGTVTKSSSITSNSNKTFTKPANFEEVLKETIKNCPKLSPIEEYQFIKEIEAKQKSEEIKKIAKEPVDASGNFVAYREYVCPVCGKKHNTKNSVFCNGEIIYFEEYMTTTFRTEHRKVYDKINFFICRDCFDEWLKQMYKAIIISFVTSIIGIIICVLLKVFWAIYFALLLPILLFIILRKSYQKKYILEMRKYSRRFEDCRCHKFEIDHQEVFTERMDELFNDFRFYDDASPFVPQKWYK